MRKALLGALPPLLLLLSCAGATPSPDGGSGDRFATGDEAAAGGTRFAGDAAALSPLSDQQVMVTYPPAPPAIWVQRTQEIAQNYRLGIVYSWTMASIGEQCVVFQVPKGRSARSVAK